jgi:hypothetical protein
MDADVFHATIAYYKKLRHTNNEKLRARTTLPRSTFYYYMRDPSEMPLGAFEQIMDSLNVPKSDRFKCFED